MFAPRINKPTAHADAKATATAKAIEAGAGARARPAAPKATAARRGASLLLCWGLVLVVLLSCWCCSYMYCEHPVLNASADYAGPGSGLGAASQA